MNINVYNEQNVSYLSTHDICDAEAECMQLCLHVYIYKHECI